MVEHRSIVGVSDDPTVIGGAATARFGHSSAQVDLTEFIVGHDDGEEGETGDSEMGESDLSCSEGFVESSGKVGQKSNEDGLEDETKVGVVVDHSLLRDGESASLADHQIGPLYADDRDKVSTLSKSEGFGSPADLSAGGSGDLVEGKTNSVIFVPSAFGPRVGGSTGVEKTDVDSIVLVTVPVEVRLGGLLHVVRVSVVEAIWLVNITRFGHVTGLKGEVEGGSGADTVVMEDIEVGEETSGCLDNSDLQVSKGDEFGIHKMVTLGITGVTFHDIELGVFVGERDGGYHISSQINAQNKYSGEGKGNLENDEEKEGRDLGDVG